MNMTNICMGEETQGLYIAGILYLREYYNSQKIKAIKMIMKEREKKWGNNHIRICPLSVRPRSG